MRKQIEILARKLAMMPKPVPFDGRVCERDYNLAFYLLRRLTTGGQLSSKLQEPSEAADEMPACIPDADSVRVSCQLIVDTYRAQTAEGVAL